MQTENEMGIGRTDPKYHIFNPIEGNRDDVRRNEKLSRTFKS